MPTYPTYTKDPDATLDYPIDWADWLGADTIASSSWAADDGITIEDDSNSTTVATVWLSGGTPGRAYSVRNRITTAAGRINDQTLLVRIQDR